MSSLCCFRAPSHSSVRSTFQEDQDLSLEGLPEEIWLLIVRYLSEPWRMRCLSRGIKKRIEGTYLPIGRSDGHMIQLMLRPWVPLLRKTQKKLELCTTIKKDSLTSESDIEEVEVIFISTIFDFLNQIRFYFLHQRFDSLWQGGVTSLNLVGMVVRVARFSFPALLSSNRSLLFSEDRVLFSQCMDSITVFLKMIPPSVEHCCKSPRTNTGGCECGKNAKYAEKELEKFLQSPDLFSIFRSPPDKRKRSEGISYHINRMYDRLLPYPHWNNREAEKKPFFLCWSKKIVAHLPTFQLQMVFIKTWFNRASKIFSTVVWLKDIPPDVVIDFLEWIINPLPFTHHFNRSSMLILVYTRINDHFNNLDQKNATLREFNDLLSKSEMGLTNTSFAKWSLDEKIAFLQEGLSESCVDLVASLVEEVNEKSTISKRVGAARKFVKALCDEDGVGLESYLEQCSMGWLLKLADLLYKHLPDASAQIEERVQKLIQRKKLQRDDLSCSPFLTSDPPSVASVSSPRVNLVN